MKIWFCEFCNNKSIVIKKLMMGFGSFKCKFKILFSTVNFNLDINCVINT